MFHPRVSHYWSFSHFRLKAGTPISNQEQNSGKRQQYYILQEQQENRNMRTSWITGTTGSTGTNWSNRNRTGTTAAQEQEKRGKRDDSSIGTPRVQGGAK
jgi:hypothetical protein